MCRTPGSLEALVVRSEKGMCAERTVLGVAGRSGAMEACKDFISGIQGIHPVAAASAGREVVGGACSGKSHVQAPRVWASFCAGFCGSSGWFLISVVL